MFQQLFFKKQSCIPLFSYSGYIQLPNNMAFTAQFCQNILQVANISCWV